MSEGNAVDYYSFLLPILLFLSLISLFSIFKRRVNNQRVSPMAVNSERLCNEEKLQRLRCSVKNYDWGKIGLDSEVYRLYSANSDKKKKIDPTKPYAEFWMGTHESGTSHVIIRRGKILGSKRICDSKRKLGDLGGVGVTTLKSWIEKNPNLLGDKVLEKWGCDLPFLFKVLSVAKPLSIQAHPCKELAKKLHMLDPGVYKDDNHKPEMALAITEFEALCGFADIQDLQNILNDVPEISQLVGADVVSQFSNITNQDGEEDVKVILKELFTQLMSASQNEVAEVLSQLIRRLRTKDNLTSKEELVLWLEEQYPDDVGVLAALFMNHVKLNPGEALCLGANELHAYLSSDCIECMATSDNVVRAGLTPKLRDVKTLCNMLTYNLGPPDILRGLNVEGTDRCIKRYRPPFEEFEVDHCDLSEGTSTSFPAIAGPSLLLVTQGMGTITTGSSVEEIHVGDVLFAPADTGFTIESDTQLELYRAGVNSKFL